MKYPMLDTNDRYYFLATILVPLVLWWIYIGRRKYGVKGMN